MIQKMYKRREKENQKVENMKKSIILLFLFCCFVFYVKEPLAFTLVECELEPNQEYTSICATQIIQEDTPYVYRFNGNKVYGLGYNSALDARFDAAYSFKIIEGIEGMLDDFIVESCNVILGAPPLTRGNYAVECSCSYTIDKISCSGNLDSTGPIGLDGLTLRGPLDKAVNICKDNLTKKTNIPPQAISFAHGCIFRIIP